MNTMEATLKRIEDKGERLTIQRRLVIEALCTHAEHQTINAIQHTVEGKLTGSKLSEVTIYRILEWLKGLGIVSQTDMGADGIVYALLDTPLHHHLVCLNCGKVIDIDDSYFSALRGKLQSDHGFRARIDHMAIYGLCADCAAQTED
ncbi:MAG: Fur family transcriptional regulator [Anaerolineae bacterium]